MKENAEEIRIQNIIEMAVMFSAMGRVFEKGSIEKINKRLSEDIKAFLNLTNMGEYKEKHKEFCQWFTKNIKTAERKKDGQISKEPHPASWGHAAKIIDIVLKVCIYYCNLPTIEASSKILPWLNGAIDTAIMNHLKKEYCPNLQIATLADIDEENYNTLQEKICEAIEKEQIGEYPVQYDDITWRKLK